MSVDDTKRCPYCDELIKAAAVKCRHCQTFLEGAQPGQHWQPAHADPPVWWEGSVLAFHKGATLPTHRCIRCGRPSEGGTMRRPIRYTTPLIWIGLVGGLLPVIILSMILTKRHKIDVGVCARHRELRRNAIIGLNVTWVAGAAIFIGSIALGNPRGPHPALLLGLLILVGALLGYAILQGMIAIVSAKKIDDDVVWLRNAHTSIFDA